MENVANTFVPFKEVPYYGLFINGEGCLCQKVDKYNYHKITNKAGMLFTEGERFIGPEFRVQTFPETENLKSLINL